MTLTVSLKRDAYASLLFCILQTATPKIRPVWHFAWGRCRLAVNEPGQRAKKPAHFLQWRGFDEENFVNGHTASPAGHLLDQAYFQRLLTELDKSAASRLVIRNNFV